MAPVHTLNGSGLAVGRAGRLPADDLDLAVRLHRRREFGRDVYVSRLGQSAAAARLRLRVLVARPGAERLDPHGPRGHLSHELRPPRNGHDRIDRRADLSARLGRCDHTGCGGRRLRVSLGSERDESRLRTVRGPERAVRRRGSDARGGIDHLRLPRSLTRRRAATCEPNREPARASRAFPACGSSERRSSSA